jgi:hypothetical protein
MRSHWIAVACADHVSRGQAQGIMQVCHGKVAPLKRMRPGDLVAYYSPAQQMGGKDKLQSFTAIGVVKEGVPYPYDMGGGFVPFRRDVAWLASEIAPIAPLVDALDFCADRRNWGYQLRFGLCAVSERDMGLIAAAMKAHLN